MPNIKLPLKLQGTVITDSNDNVILIGASNKVANALLTREQEHEFMLITLHLLNAEMENYLKNREELQTV